MAFKLTQEEANKLIESLKKYVEQNKLTFPEAKKELIFFVFADKTNDKFKISIQRKGINRDSCSYVGVKKPDNIALMRLDIGNTHRHKNPSNDEVLVGSHLHIYTEEYYDKEAIPFDVNNKNLYQLCYDFFERFNIVEYPNIIYEPDLF